MDNVWMAWRPEQRIISLQVISSQADKAYYDTDGSRPTRVLVCNLRPSPAAQVNGVCIPVDAAGLDALRARERRYAPQQIAVEPYPGWPHPECEVLAFLGR